VLLPPLGKVATSEIFAILAGTDARGAEVLTRRIHEQMKRCPELDEYEITLASREVLRPLRSDMDTPGVELDAMIEEITRAVSQAVNGGVKSS